MKKIFTLIAVAAMAINANAQSYKIAEGDKFTVGQEITSVANIKMIFGGAAQTYKDKNDADKTDTWKDAVAHTTAFESVGYAASTDGNGNNPVGDDNKSSLTPTRGTFYVFEPAAAGSLEVCGVFNADKTVVVSEDGVDITSTITYKGTAEDGTEIEGLTFTDNKFSAKLYGTLTFNVKAGSKYYVMIQGSKMGFAGFTFTAGGESGIASVKAAKANAAEYNLAGQKVAAGFKGLVIKDGKKVIK